MSLPGDVGRRVAGGRHPRPSVTLVAAVIGDGYLYGASGDLRHAFNAGYWLPLRLDREPYALFEAHVPPDMAADFEAQGTSDQYFDDGYDAMSEIAPYLDPEPFYESPESWDAEREREED